MLGEDSAATDADTISLDGLVITDTTAEEEGGDAKCGNIPVPSNSPDLVDQVISSLGIQDVNSC